MKNEFKDISNYLTAIELNSIEKINKRIKSLQSKTASYFSEFDSISLENIEEGYVRNSDLDALTEKYFNLIDTFQLEIREIQEKCDTDIVNKLSETDFQKIGRKNLQLIRNTLNNFKLLYTLTEKIDALGLISKLHDLEIEDRGDIIQTYGIKLQNIKLSVSSENIIRIRRLAEDFEEIENLNIEPKSRIVRMSLIQRVMIASATVTSITIMGVMIWLLTK